MMEKRPSCDYYGCSEEVCDWDLENLSPPTRRHCQKHSDELQAIIDIEDAKESAQKMLGWWVTSLGGAEQATKHILRME